MRTLGYALVGAAVILWAFALLLLVSGVWMDKFHEPGVIVDSVYNLVGGALFGAIGLVSFVAGRIALRYARGRRHVT